MLIIDHLLNVSSKWFYPLRWLLITLIGLAIYYQTFSFGFVFDDNQFIVDNPYIKNFNSIHHMWTLIPKTRLIGIYSFAINYFFNHLNPEGYHIFNFIVHLIAVGLVWGTVSVLFKITKCFSNNNPLRQELPFFIALLFLVHPCQTQAITYITQRFESIATVFYLGSLLCYLCARIATIKKQQIILFCGSSILALLGIFTKEVAVTVPLMIFVSELILFPKNLQFKRISIAILIALCFSLLFIKLVRTDLDIFFTYTAPSESHDGDTITSATYLLTQMRVFQTFLRLLVLPINQNVDYDYPLSSGLLNPPLTLVGVCLIGLIIFLIIKLRKKFSLISFGLAWILITFSINLAPRIHVIFEHKLYLISFGFLLAIICGLSVVIRNPKILLGTLSCLVAILGLTSFNRNHVWKNEQTLWEDTIQKSPQKQRVWANLGRVYAMSRQYNKAIPILDKAIILNPTDFKSHVTRGAVFSSLGSDNPALADFNKAIEINPKHFVGYLERAKLNEKQKNDKAAFLDLEQVIRLAPKFQYGYIERGFLLLEKGRTNEALKDFNTALGIAPGDLQALNGRAMVYSATGQLELTIQDLTQYLQLDPTNALMYKNRGLCLLKLGRQQEALKDFNTALQYNPNDPEISSILHLK